MINDIRMYGAIGDGTTDDSVAIQSAVDACSSAWCGLYFPPGNYKINSQINITGKTRVFIIGEGAKLISGITTVGNALIYVYDCSDVDITGIAIDFNASAITHHGIRLGNTTTNTLIQGRSRVVRCDFLNFGTETTTGIRFDNTPDTSLAFAVPFPPLLVDQCNFYNQITTEIASFNYSTAAYYGKGVYFGDRSEYWKITNCNFLGIRIGVESYGGANGLIQGCNFIYVFSKISGAYTYGAIYYSNTGANNGKLLVSNCKFNHNFGYSIYWAYATAERPITVSNCHFISNANTAIYIAGGSRHLIIGNHFDRCNAHVGKTNDPWSGQTNAFVYMNNTSRCAITNNQFINDSDYGVETAGTSDYNEISYNRWYNITGISSLTGANNVQTGNNNL